MAKGINHISKLPDFIEDLKIENRTDAVKAFRDDAIALEIKWKVRADRKLWM